MPGFFIYQEKSMLKRLIEEYVIYRKNPFTLKSGQMSNWYVDLRPLSLSMFGAYYIVQELWDILDDVDFDCIGGLSIGADPIVGACLYAGLADKGFLVRPENKTYGKGGRIVGDLKPGDRCVLIDDVVTTGHSLYEAANLVKSLGCEVVKLVCVLNRGNAKVESLYRLEDFIEE